MRTTQAARYARWSAILAVLVASFVGGAYLRHAWQAYKAHEAMPRAVPSAVQQQAAEFSFSKVTGDHAEFTVRASHATEFAEGGRSLLEDVWVTFYGQDGARADNLHTRSCELLATGGNILCAGDVHIDLQSADDARLFPGTLEHPNPAAHIMHITTNHVSFDRSTGITASDQPVHFQFPQGQGSAVGLRYDSHQEELQLLHNVDLNFEQAPGAANVPAAFRAGPNAADQTVHVTAGALDFRRDQRVIHLQGPVQAQQGLRRLDAGRVDVELDPMLQARRVVISSKPRLTTLEQKGETISVVADQFSVFLAAQGWIERIAATGNFRAEARGDLRTDRLDAARADIAMTPGANQPQSLTASESVVAQSDGPGGLSRQLATSKLELQFAPDDPPAKAPPVIADAKPAWPPNQTPNQTNDAPLSITAASTPAAALDWRIPADRAAKKPAEHTHLSAEHLEAAFAQGSEVREVRGSGNVQVQRQIGDGEPQTSTSSELTARLIPGGDWSSIDLAGDVNLRQADQVARADAAHFDHSTDIATLKGSIALSDPRYRLTARSAIFEQQTNEFRADGDVVSSEVAAQNGDKNASATNLGPGPARISANGLVLNTATGHAVYSGQARLWQGTSLVEADRIELDRSAQSLTADGRVRAVFPQAPVTASGDLAPKPPPKAKAAAAKPDAKPEFVRTEAGHLTYRSADGLAVLDHGVVSRSSEGTMQSDAMNLYFTSAKQAGAAAPAPSVKAVSAVADPPSSLARGQASSLPAAGQQLVRATALGHVTVQQGDRRATASQADYTSAEGKFVLSGGAPTVHDSSGNSASGRQLTLFFADDTIVIDSGEGSRTLTLHRVE